MRFSIKNYMLEILKAILILTMVLQIMSILVSTFLLIKDDNTYETKSNQSEPCDQMMTLSGNNTMMVLKNEKLSDCSYRLTIEKKIYKYFMVQRIINSCFVFLVVLQLSLIFKTFPFKVFQTIKNSVRVKYIAFTIFIWSIMDYIVRFYPSKVIPESLFYSSYGINFLTPELLSSQRNINFTLFLVAVLIYLFSIAFKHGSELQQEANQTI